MKSKKLFAALLLVLIHIFAFPQVNLQTGAAQASIPLYSYVDAGNRIGTAVSLDYISGSGLKVNEMASSVGTGWTLNLGGVITRVQHGEPDDQRNGGVNFGYYLTGDYAKNYFPNGYLYSEFDPSILVDNGGGFSEMAAYGNVWMPRKKYLADREQDEFQFSFNGRSGTFYIGRNGEILTTTSSKLKIYFDTVNMWSSGIRTKIASFQIKDESGVRYIFKDIELSEVIKYDQSYSDIVYGRGLGQFVVSKWYLTEIVNPFTNKKITFTYDTYEVDLNTTHSVQKSTFSNGSEKIGRLWSKTKGKAKRITSIICSDLEKVEFNYSDLSRADFPSDKALSTVTIKYNGIAKYSWNLSFGYFKNTSVTAFDDPQVYDTLNSKMVRLCLLSLQKTGSGTSEPPYHFAYNLDHRIPNMFTYYHDNWGYANNDSRWGTDGAWDEWYNLTGAASLWGKNNPINNPELFRGVASGYAATGIIKTITYPLGGSLTFEYEQNSAVDRNNTSHEVGGVRVVRTKLFDGIDHNNDIVTEYKYVQANGLNTSGGEIDGTTTSGWGYEPFAYSKTLNIKMYPVCDYCRVAGVPSGPSNMQVIKTIGSGGNIFVYGPSIQAQLIMAVVSKFLGDIFRDAMQPLSTNVTSQIAFSDALNSVNMLPLLYTRVEVIPKAGVTTNGKTVSEFTYEDVTLDPFYPYSSRPRIQHWKYSLPDKTWLYDKNDKLLKRVEYNYNYIDVSPYNNTNFWSQKWAPKSLFYDDFDSYTTDDYQPDNLNISHDTYFPLIGRAELTETREYTFNSNNQSSLVITDFTYSANNYQLQSVSTTNSKGESVQTSTFYPEDFQLTGVNKTMRDSNMLNFPVAIQSEIQKNGSPYVVSGSVLEYGFIANGDIRPLRNYKLESAQPVDRWLVDLSQQSLTLNTDYYKEQQSFTYNALGLVEGEKASNKKIGKLYGYDNKLVTAEIVNANANESFFDSFEEPGIWDGVSYSTSAHIGKYAGSIYKWNQGSKSCQSIKWLNISLTQDTKFKLSGWVYSDHPFAYIDLVMQTATGQESYDGLYMVTRTVGKWIYLEKDITVPANVTKLSVKIRNSGALSDMDYGGTVWFDDIKLHPSNARMVTYTYDPLVGMTSQTDANNRSVYYEYDGLTRLIRILDNDHNILKKYCYNYAGQPESCPQYTVGNDAQTRTIRKNDCNAPNGYYGSEIIYTVPANKYFGSDKPSANSLAGAEIDREGQSYANLNGTCIQGVSNDERSQTFTRNNCYPGKTGSQVTYTVPAGKWAAATKPEANQLADDEIAQNGQVYANTNGTCLYYSGLIDEDFYSRSCASNLTPVPYHVTIPAGSFSSYASPSDADYYARQEAQRQADINGQCSNTYTPIYARLEVNITDGGSQWGNYNDYYDGIEFWDGQVVSMYLRFYSDPDCTQPLAIPRTVNYTINTQGYMDYTDSYQYYGPQVSFEGTAPIGATEVFFDSSLSFEGFWGFYHSDGSYWTYYEKSRDDYELGSADGAIIVSPIYPSHTNGY